MKSGEGTPAILIEHCFIQGNDYKYVSNDSKIKQLAEADGKAIVEHYGLNIKDGQQEENSDIKIDDSKKHIIVSPTQNKENIEEYFKKDTITILDSNDKQTETIATGGKIKTKDKTYEIIKLGDVNGDGKVKANDALATLKHSMGTEMLTGVYLEAAKVTSSESIKATNALQILKYSMGLVQIQL
ncbi:MAG: dockerin type I repeat-containing protein [Clostridia bacterium]|nr:dockerin type I repeat-containing protein [Clostridia bacterium]